MTTPPLAAPAGGKRPRVGLVSSRHRLCAAAGRPLDDAPALLAAQVEAARDCGVEFFQVREPDLAAARLVRLVRDLAAVAGRELRIAVNDRADLAAAARADLHLKSGSMRVSRLRPWLSASTWVSRAVHDVAEAESAGDVAVLIAGTVQDTASKAAGTPRLGFDGLARITAATTRPVFAIGGLTAADWPQIAAAGAVGIAAIGWMLPRPGEDPAAAVARAMADVRAVVDGRAVVS
ncbi:MAG: thiamine phosphate synthase [Acidobacteriota bacterium]